MTAYKENVKAVFDKIIEICDHPLCYYGFPCPHQFGDEDSGEGFCAYPETKGTATGPLTADMSSSDCPIICDLTTISEKETVQTFTCYACPDGRCYSKTKKCKLNINAADWEPSDGPEDWERPSVTVI